MTHPGSRGGRRARQRIGEAVVEALAGRVLLSTSLAGSVLTIDGTEGNDRIVVAANKRFINILTVGNNADVKSFALSAVTSIHVNALGGDDKVIIDSSLDPMQYDCFVDAGAGNDSVYTGAGDDTVIGGDGNDKIYTNYGYDSIDGGNGRDLIDAGIGNDTINGGAHNDILVGGVGNDSISPGKGNDYVDAGDGDDTINDPAGNEYILAGAGDDTGKIGGTGLVAGQGDRDIFVATGGASLYGGDGNDNLQGSWLDGGKGNDTLSGLLGDDVIYGGAGDDLIRGFAGHDALYGNDGNDALFGGVDTDTLYGGKGDDNLYGTDGAADKHKGAAGTDDGFGQAGSDWFETDYPWRKGDYQKGVDRQVNSQNSLVQDPSAGLYTSGTLRISNNLNAGSLTLSNGTLSGTINLNDNVTVTNPGTIHLVTDTVSSTIVTKFLPGGAGFLSSGAYDTTQNKFVPPAMSHTQRITAGHVILQLPAGWNLGAMSFARDGIVWYGVSVDNATPPTSTSSLTIGGTTASNGIINVTNTGTYTLNGITTNLVAGNYTLNNGVLTLIGGTGTTTPTTPTSGAAEPTYTVPTLDGGTTQVPQSTPHLYDGVNSRQYRFLGVKSGTILIDGDGSITDADPKQWGLSATCLALPTANVTYRLAGHATTYHAASEFDSLPTGGPKLHGILLVGGAIWLPTDGVSEPYFSSGK